MGNSLKDRVAVVTGAGRGIGKSVAMLLAEEGAKVVVNDLGGSVDGTSEGSKSPADEVVSEIKSKGGEAVANYESVSEWESSEKIIKTALDSYGKLDILVNVAGILRDRMVFNMTKEEWDLVLRVHLYGTFNCIRHACPIMRSQKGGRIINFSSEAGLGNLGQANYSAAKEGIIGLTRTVARDMGKYGVTCNAIRPRAGTRMTLTDELREAMDRKRDSGIGGPIEGGMLDLASLHPDDVAPMTVFLATDEAANINGYDFAVGGGMISLLTQPQVIKSMNKDGRWTVDEISALAPTLITGGLVNPVPPAPPK